VRTALRETLVRRRYIRSSWHIWTVKIPYGFVRREERPSGE
jgi:hypothetical protein